MLACGQESRLDPQDARLTSSTSGLPLSRIDVLVIDCQATAAAPRGHLLEIGWMRASAAPGDVHACLVALPDGERVPSAVTRITGITDRLMRSGVEACEAWQLLAAAAAALTPQPPPTVIHFARFEQPFLSRLAGGVPPLDIVCVHAIAQRLLPELPRRSLRALAGYFGRAVGVPRRSPDHVNATAFVWRELVRLLESTGVDTWDELKAWLTLPVASTTRRRRAWPMPRDVRLALPDAPGVYRMLRTSGDVLYVGKAASLHKRVNSHFRHRRGVSERMLEMLSQARGISFEVTPTALEAALLEPDEIKRFQPPYNIALAGGDRQLWFADRDLIDRSPRPSLRCPIGPFPSIETLEQFAALVRGSRAALGRDQWAPAPATFRDGYARFCAAYAELSLNHPAMPGRLLRLGTRLWREGRRDREATADEPAADAGRVGVWTPENVQRSLECIALRAALARRRAMWFTRLADATVVWREPGDCQEHLIIIENGDITLRVSIDTAAPPIPPGHRRSAAARREGFTVARFDRLRVLTTELKRLAAAGAPVQVRVDAFVPLSGARLASVLGWL